jgi:ABC-2 type transport system permease protein
MKVFDIALKDLIRSFRSASAVVFMFGIPLLVTGMFYLMFGNIAANGEFSLPRTKVIVANLDEGGPRFRVSVKNIPGSKDARTIGELVVGVLQSEEMADLVEVSLASSAEAARAAVDGQVTQVAVIIPPDFSRQYADPDGQAVLEFYQDPTLTIGPSIIRTILNRFMDGMAGVKITLNLFLDEATPADYALTGQVVQQYLDTSLAQTADLAGTLLDTDAPAEADASTPASNSENFLLRLISPIMGGMMVFYAFFTATSTAQSILREEEERTLPRLFTTPTPQAVILSGKYLAVFLTVLVQVTVLILAARLMFGIEWGRPELVIPAAGGIIFMASSCGIFINSLLKDTRQSGAIFGGVLTISGMLGMIGIFALDSPSAARLSETVSLLVPQGWAVRGLLQAMNNAQVRQVWLTGLVMLAWSALFFGIGVWRFAKRYA